MLCIYSFLSHRRCELKSSSLVPLHLRHREPSRFAAFDLSFAIVDTDCVHGQPLRLVENICLMQYGWFTQVEFETRLKDCSASAQEGFHCNDGAEQT